MTWDAQPLEGGKTGQRGIDSNHAALRTRESAQDGNKLSKLEPALRREQALPQR
jgi:hypothetical protein